LWRSTPTICLTTGAGAWSTCQGISTPSRLRFGANRQAKIFSRFGVELSDKTMGGWVKQSADLLDPLYRELKNFVLSSKVVGTDDTPVKVLDPNLPQTRKGRIWPYVGDRDNPAIIYDYTPTRERAGPKEFLKDFRGHLPLDCPRIAVIPDGRHSSASIAARSDSVSISHLRSSAAK
jgi:Transposase IS66 family